MYRDQPENTREECYDADSNHTVFLKFGKRCIVFLFVGFVNIFCTVVNKEWFLSGFAEGLHSNEPPYAVDEQEDSADKEHCTVSSALSNKWKESSSAERTDVNEHVL